MEIFKERKLRFNLKYFFISLFLLFPLAVSAANVGFVPSTGLWFSRTEFLPKETIRIYTVVINNDYVSLDGVIALYDNSDIVDTVEVKGLPKEGAQLIRVFWEPTEGQHAVSARFIKATATDERGIKQAVDLQTINSVAGAPLTVSSGSITPVTSNDPQKILDQLAAVGAPIPASTTLPSATLSEVQLVVKKEGEKLALTPSALLAVETSGAGVSTASVLGEKQAATTSDPFARNRSILQKAEKVASTITSTAGTVDSAVGKTKSAVEKGKGLAAEWRDKMSWLEERARQLEPFWQKVSNHNEPKRVAMIVGGALVAWWIARRLWRRRDYRESRRH